MDGALVGVHSFWPHFLSFVLTSQVKIVEPKLVNLNSFTQSLLITYLLVMPQLPHQHGQRPKNGKRVHIKKLVTIVMAFYLLTTQ
jgi:hypothetical protein